MEKIEIQYFLRLLISSDPFLKKHALNIVHYIINGTPESHDVFSRFGLINYLVLIIRDKDENYSLAITTLGNLLAANLIKRIYIKEGLPSLCVSLNEHNKGQILGFLRRIINRSDKEYIDILLQYRIMPTLIKLFRFGTNSTPLHLSHVIKIMGHIFHQRKEHIIEFFETPNTLDCVNELLQSNLELKKKLGIWLLSRIINQQSIDYLFMSPKVLVTVFQIRQNGSWKLQKNASLIFVKIVQMSKNEHIQFILEKYGMKVLYLIQPLLDITLPDIEEQDIIEALEAINKIFEFNQVWRPDLSFELFDELRSLLQILQSHNNQTISDISQKIILVIQESSNF